MARATRSSGGQRTRSGIPAASQPSSGTTIFDESFNAADEEASYATPSRINPSSFDQSRLSQHPEPLPFRQMSSNYARDELSGTTNDLAGEQDDLPHPPTKHTNALGTHINEVIAAISRLEGLGLQNLEVKLPKCVVLGEQSAGKSSVIEAISGIRTPRSTGTCTRCPLFIKLERSRSCEGWQARITLRIKYGYDGLSQGKFPEWELKPSPEEVPFLTCRSPDMLEQAISQAQLAIVHPLEDPERFARGSPPLDPDRVHSVSFSPNVVCIYVSHPELPDLSFYDLPGLIGQAENPGDVDVVKNLVQDYVQDPDALVLVACALSVDIATSLASGSARQWDASERCIGVFTKPDLFPEGTPDKDLLCVLNGSKFSLGHGYFVVKNPNQVDLQRGLSHQHARDEEQMFFTSNEPWSTRFRAYHDRFGAANLQQYLSKTLASQMVKALPAIYQQIQVRLDDVEARLRELPEPPTHDAPRAVADVLQAFCTHVRKEMEAEYPCRFWRNTWGELQKGFMENLVAMKPTMRINGELDTFGNGDFKGTVQEPFILSDDEDEHLVLQESPTKKRKVEEPVESQFKSQMKTSNKTRPPTPNPFTPKRPVPKTPSCANTNATCKARRHVFVLDDVADHLKTNSISKIPNQLQPKVIDAMIIEAVKPWDFPMKVFIKDLGLALRAQLNEIFEEHFKKCADTPLYREASSHLEAMIQTTFNEQSMMAKDSLADETEGPYIFHSPIFNAEMQSILDIYKTGRSKARLRKYALQELVPSDLDRNSEQFEHAQKEMEKKILKDEKKRAEIAKDPYHFEVSVLARITSYYTVAARRFHDSICMRVESKLFKRLRDNLYEDLDMALGTRGAGGSEKAVQLFAESTQRAELRKSLHAQRDALLQGKHHLDRLTAKHRKDADGHGSSGGFASALNSCREPTSTTFAEDMEGIARAGGSH